MWKRSRWDQYNLRGADTFARRSKPVSPTVRLFIGVIGLTWVIAFKGGGRRHRMNWNAVLLATALAFAAAALYVMMIDHTYAQCLTENSNPGLCLGGSPTLVMKDARERTFRPRRLAPVASEGEPDDTPPNESAPTDAGACRLGTARS
jgi:hypothetical protein